MKRIRTPYPLLPYRLLAFPLLPFPLLLLFATACVPLTPIAATSTPTATRTALPTGIPSATPIATVSAGPLQIVTVALSGEPVLDPLNFTTAQGRHVSIRDFQAAQGEPFPDRSFFEDMHFSMWAQLGPDRLIAREEYASAADGKVSLLRNKHMIYETPVGHASSLTALRGLWAYDDHWVLETAFITVEDRDGIETSLAAGRLTQDGVLLNEANGYDESFGFQTIAARPFYFFKRGGVIDAWYDGQEIRLGYDRVPHYGCCSPAELNPFPSQDRVAFFGVRGEAWYFIQIGTAGSFRSQ